MARALLLALAACGGGDGDGGETDTTGGATESDTDVCADPSYNPFAGTCVVTFLGDCFDPVGTCSTAGSMTSFSFTWDNGARIEFAMTDIGIFAADGTECATGTATMGGGECVSTTIYRRSSDGTEQTWCTQADGLLTVTCDDGTVIDVDTTEAAAASGCGFGEGGACEPPDLF